MKEVYKDVERLGWITSDVFLSKPLFLIPIIR